MFHPRDLKTFEQLDALMGNEEIVKQANGRYKELSDSQLFALWKSARERLKSNGLSSCYPNPKSAIPDVISAMEIACVRKQFNTRRDELLEKNVKSELEKLDDKTIFICAKFCEPKEIEEVKRFGKVRSLYRKLKRFRQKFGFRREYRWEYESTKVQYLNLRRYLISYICNYVMHPNKSDGEYSACQNDEGIKIDAKNNRSKILRIKERMLRVLRRKPSLYDSVIECGKNLNYQNIQQQVEREDLSLIKNVLLKVCPHDDHDFLECQNLKQIKEALNHSSAYR